MKEMISVSGIFILFLGVIVFLAKNNSKLREKVKERDDELDAQKQVVRLYEEKQKRVEEIGNNLKKEEALLKERIDNEEKSVESSIDIGNDIVNLFNGMRDNEK